MSFNLYAICRNDRCDNYGKEFMRRARKSTYEASDGRIYTLEGEA